MQSIRQQQVQETGISEPVRRLMDMYQRLNAGNLGLLDEVYSNQVCFCDPLHRIEGMAALKVYFAAMYQNVSTIEFEFHRVIDDGQSAVLVWTMRFTHPKLASGKVIDVDGVTEVRYDQQIHYHRDYFDVGSMLYEHLPVLGPLVRFVKHRAGN